jgi:hypothetical protein
MRASSLRCTSTIRPRRSPTLCWSASAARVPSSTRPIWCLADLSVAAIRLHPVGLFVRSALGLALAHGLTAYDAAYVALATRVGGVVISNDATLRRRAAEVGLPVAAPAEVA